MSTLAAAEREEPDLDVVRREMERLDDEDERDREIPPQTDDDDHEEREGE
jgi:hypothetical protein